VNPFQTTGSAHALLAARTDAVTPIDAPRTFEPVRTQSVGVTLPGRSSDAFTESERAGDAANAAPGRVVAPRLEDIGRYATQGADMPWGALLIAIGILIAVVAAISLRRLHATRNLSPSATLAFLLITRRLGIGWSHRYLLYQISRGTRLSTPITLLLAPGTLHDHARQFVAGMSMRRRDHTMRRVAAIERILYADREAADPIVEPGVASKPRAISELAALPRLTDAPPEESRTHSAA
jgi:hypothetical protein